MLPAELLQLWTTMALAGKVVSKRSARMYIEDETEKQPAEYQPKRMSFYDEGKTEHLNGKDSTSTATSQNGQSSRQTSLEVSPMISAVGEEAQVETIPLEALDEKEYKGKLGAVDVFESVQGYAAFADPGPHEILPTVGRPANFGIVVPGVYRSSFPQAEDYPFIEALKLKTVV